jgi:hypothetical protein
MRINRRCTPELWHTYHGKNKWHESYDGKHRSKPWEAAKMLRKAGAVDYRVDRTWVLPLLEDGAQRLYRSQANNTYECRNA